MVMLYNAEVDFSSEPKLRCRARFADAGHSPVQMWG